MTLGSKKNPGAATPEVTVNLPGDRPYTVEEIKALLRKATPEVTVTIIRSPKQHADGLAEAKEKPPAGTGGKSKNLLHQGDYQMSTKLATIPVPGATRPIMAVQHDGTEWASAKHVCDALGIDWKSQHRKLESKPWAVMVMMTTTAADGKNYQTSMVDRRTLTMWLATIDTNRVSEAARPTLEAYQLEAANALDAYFHNGGAINPRAEEHQLNALMRQSQMQMELCQAAKGLIHPDHLEAKARIVLARGLGEVPELNPETRPLYTADFLKSKNLSNKKMKSVAPMFGKRMKALYTLEKGREPEKYDLTLSNGQVRQVNGYTEADRELMQRVWDQYYTTA